jgi:type IV pilus assembly protein PilN
VDEVTALVSVFDQIRPWSAVLQDLRDRIPKTVEIDDIRQIAPLPPPPPQAKGPVEPVNLAGGLEISGIAHSFNDVNDFLLILQQSKFMKSDEERIVSAELTPLPGLSSKSADSLNPASVVKYTIRVGLNDVPASTLIKELEQNDSMGLVDRLMDIKKVGVISK